MDGAAVGFTAAGRIISFMLEGTVVLLMLVLAVDCLGAGAR